MKVIIVTDLHDDFDFKSKANVQIKTKNGVIDRTHLKIKRLPQKMESGKIENGTKANIPIPVEHFAMGWNACLEEIMGETEY